MYGVESISGPPQFDLGGKVNDAAATWRTPCELVLSIAHRVPSLHIKGFASWSASCRCCRKHRAFPAGFWMRRPRPRDPPAVHPLHARGSMAQR